MILGEMARATSRWLGVTAAGVGNLGRQRNGKLGGCYEGRNCYWRWDVITAQHQPETCRESEGSVLSCPSWFWIEPE